MMKKNSQSNDYIIKCLTIYILNNENEKKTKIVRIPRPLFLDLWTNFFMSIRFFCITKRSTQFNDAAGSRFSL